MPADVGSVATERLDLAAASSPALPPRADGRDVHLTVWLGEVPLAAHQFNHRGLPSRAFADQIAHLIADPVGARLLERGFEGADPAAGLPAPDTAPDLAQLIGLERPMARYGAAVSEESVEAPQRITLAICTRERPEQLARCLRSVLRSQCVPDEVIVVDNAPSEATRLVVQGFAGARYVAESRSGLSIARNTAIREASGDVIAFVDDDTEVTPRWLGRLCAPFEDPEVASTTGLVLPGGLDTPSQLQFEKILGGFGRGFHRLVYGPEFFARMRPLGVPVWKVGAGANMAIRMTALKRVGLFDERLGAGASGCSEDSELWYRLLAEDWTCLYEPSSVVFHHHRGDEAGFRRQAHQYIRGHMSALFVQYARYGHVGNLRRALWLMPRSLVRQAALEANRRCLTRLRLRPAELRRPALTQLSGYLRGLMFLPVVVKPKRSFTGKAPLRRFLARNPFPRPLTEGFFYREKMRAIHRIAPDASPGAVLEVGGGQSGMARLLYPNAQVTVLDAERSYAESSTNQDPRVTFVHGDATRLPFADASFDVVTFFDVLEHIADDRAAAAEAVRVVRPGGYILASSPNERWRSPYHRVMRPFCPSDEEMIERWAHMRRGYSVAEFSSLFGAPPAVRADFINRLTVVGHDIAFSHLPGGVRRALLILLLPFTLAAYLLQPRGARGTETAARWRRPAA